jgi:hypothetical protein
VYLLVQGKDRRKVKGRETKCVSCRHLVRVEEDEISSWRPMSAQRWSISYHDRGSMHVTLWSYEEPEPAIT